VRSQREIWIPIVMLMVIGTLTFNYTVVLPLFVTDALGAPDTSYTLLYASLSLGSVIAALVAARRSTVTVRQIVGGALALGVSLSALALSPNMTVAYVVAPLPGYSSVMFMTTMTTLIQLRASVPMRVRVLALQGMIMMGTTPIGGPTLGAVSDLVGARASVLIGGVAAVSAGLWGLRAERRRAISPQSAAAPDDAWPSPRIRDASGSR
jgi:MFS family permease